MPELRVAEGTIKDTHCANDFSCLAGKKECLCEVESTVGKVIFIKSQFHIACKYCLSYGGSFICTCPTRNEIYNKYGL